MAFACVIAVVLVVAPSASAKIWFRGVDARTYEAGQLVRAAIAGCRGNTACARAVAGVQIYVTPATPATGTWNPDTIPQPRWYVGKVTRDGSIAFRIPVVKRGDYRLVARLGGSAKPRFFVASGGFRVR
jgi:hypothetical protein